MDIIIIRHTSLYDRVHYQTPHGAFGKRGAMMGSVNPIINIQAPIQH
jgi:hypothetical protein